MSFTALLVYTAMRQSRAEALPQSITLFLSGFFGRSLNRAGKKTEGIFTSCPWGYEHKSVLLCYECHELLLHNPVLLPEEVARFAELVRIRNLAEDVKPEDHLKIARRVELLHDVIRRGLEILLKEETGRDSSNREPG